MGKQATHPNAKDAGTPRSGRLRKDRSERSVSRTFSARWLCVRTQTEDACEHQSWEMLAWTGNKLRHPHVPINSRKAPMVNCESLDTDGL